MERNVSTFRVRLIGLCSLVALDVALVITGVMMDKLWIWLIALVVSAIPVFYFRLRDKKILSEYFNRKRLTKRNQEPG